MECATCREALSARLDGEAPGARAGAVDLHLERCAACRDWQRRAVAALRPLRVSPAEPVPDLTHAILAAAPIPRRPTPPPVDAAVPLRIGLVVIALVQLAVAIPELWSGGHGAAVHVAVEQGSWEIALGAALLAVAWRPALGAGMVPLLGALVGTLVLSTGIDAAGGHTTVLDQSAHLLPIAGLILLFALRRLAPSTPRRRARPARQRAVA